MRGSQWEVQGGLGEGASCEAASCGPLVVVLCDPQHLEVGGLWGHFHGGVLGRVKRSGQEGCSALTRVWQVELGGPLVVQVGGWA